MEITTKTKIFPHPDHCNLPNDKRCKFLHYDSYRSVETCVLFEKDSELMVDDEMDHFFIKCPECKEAYQIALKEKEEPDLKKELGKFMEKTLRPEQEPFHKFMSRQYPDIEYLCMFVDEKGFQKYPEMDILKGYDANTVRTLKDDMKSLYGIEVSEVDKLKDIP